MIGKEKIKFVRSLHQKKFRQKYNKFMVEGTKIVSECIACLPEQIDTIYALSTYIQTLDIQDSTIKEKLIEIDHSQLNKISALENPSQVLAVMNRVAELDQKVEGDAIYLDSVQIPQNVGAILRIAEWFGIKNILLSPNTADIYSHKVIQASMGSFIRLNFQVLEPDALNIAFPNHSIIVADGSGMSLTEHVFEASTILVLGNEGHGPRQSLKDQADGMVSIDRISGQFPESLNVAVAAGIICHSWKGKK